MLSFPSNFIKGYRILTEEGPFELLDRLKSYFRWRIRNFITLVYSYGSSTIYDIADFYWERTISTTTTPEGGRGVAFDGRRAISSARKADSVYIWDAVLEEPEITGSATVETANHVTMDDRYGYVTQREGTSILHAINLASAEIVSSIEASGWPYTYGVKVAPEQGIGVVADRTGMIATIDVRDPTSMSLLDKLSIPEFAGATQIEIIDGYILVGGKDSYSLITVDSSDPSNLQVANSLDSDRLILVDGFEYRDGHLYTAAGSTWGTELAPRQVDWQLNVLDLTDPENPKFVGQLISDELGKCYGLEQEGNLLFASSYTNRQVVVIDISDESNPTIKDIGKGLEFHKIHCLDIEGGIGVTVSTNGRLTVFDANY